MSRFVSGLLWSAGAVLMLAAFAGRAQAIGGPPLVAPELSPGTLAGALTLAGAGAALVVSRWTAKRAR